MSDDLISRSALLEELKDFRMIITGATKNNDHMIMNETKKSIMRIIEEQPTAYDVDKVMEQVKEKGIAICCSVKCNDNCKDCDHGCLIKDILEIVKSGGVADE